MLQGAPVYILIIWTGKSDAAQYNAAKTLWYDTDWKECQWDREALVTWNSDYIYIYISQLANISNDC